jgi:hypothetical protein
MSRRQQLDKEEKKRVLEGLSGKWGRAGEGEKAVKEERKKSGKAVRREKIGYFRM